VSDVRREPEAITAEPAATGVVVDDPWAALRRFTAARVGLGRSGVSMPTAQVLAFELAHARARDAVLTPLDTDALRLQLTASSKAWGLDCISVASRAATRSAYLANPGLGRRLHDDSRSLLLAQRIRRTRLLNLAEPPEHVWDLAFVISDGLSSTAVASHATPVLCSVMPLLSGLGLSIAPLVIASQARVALGDDVGEILGARMSISLIGERPGLSSPDSLGIYMTYAPRVGRSDAERNCISNVRPEGLAYTLAAEQIIAWLEAATRQRESGVRLRVDPAITSGL